MAGQQSSRQRVLLVGGAGYIGSHVYVSLWEAGFQPVVLETFATSHPSVLRRLEQLTGSSVPAEKVDIHNTIWVQAVLKKHGPVAVIHLAGQKCADESVFHPLKYFHSNVDGTVSLLRAMEAEYLSAASPGPPTLVFPSSAAVYGDPATLPVSESAPQRHTTPYGHTKQIIESMLASVLKAQPCWRIGILRCFNVVGAHPSGLIGDRFEGSSSPSLMHSVARVAMDPRAHLNVFGSDYPSPDGTPVRDYIHVQDVASGTVAALRALLENSASFTVNLGTGRGSSVLDVVREFEHASGRKVPYEFAGRRPGDVAQCYADPCRACELLGWKAARTLLDMCVDAWRWQCQSPHGYQD